MMKNSLWLLMISSLLISCSKYDIKLYDENPRLDFLFLDECIFNDVDCINNINNTDNTDNNIDNIINNVINNIKPKEFQVPIHLLGYKLNDPLNYCIKFLPRDESSEDRIQLSDLYSFPTNKDTSYFTILATCPQGIGMSYTGEFHFDVENSNHQFAAGRAEKSKVDVLIKFDIYPPAWEYDGRYFGLYSNNKYLLMMDYFKKVYAGIERTEKNLLDIHEYYHKVYKKKYPPLMDDDPKNPQEISFPVQEL